MRNDSIALRKKAFRKCLSALDERFFEGKAPTFWMVKFDGDPARSASCEIGRFDDDMRSRLVQLDSNYFTDMVLANAKFCDDRAMLMNVRIKEEPPKKFEMPVECE